MATRRRQDVANAVQADQNFYALYMQRCAFFQGKECTGAHRTDEGESSTELLWVTGVLIHLQQCCEFSHLEQHLGLPYLLHLETAHMTASLRMGQLSSLHALFDVMLCQEAIGKTRSFCGTKPATTFNHKVKVSTGNHVA
jgi:hypothetical protein